MTKRNARLMWMGNPNPMRFGDVCCWPDCDESAELDRIPLCLRHLTKAWRTYDETYLWMLREQREVATRAATQEWAKDRDERGLVYFIRFGDRVKIGFTTNLRQRLNDLPHDELLGTVGGSLADEKRCHAAFDHLRVTGEWFRAEADLMAFIADVCTVQPKVAAT